MVLEPIISLFLMCKSMISDNVFNKAKDSIISFTKYNNGIHDRVMFYTFAKPLLESGIYRRWVSGSFCYKIQGFRYSYGGPC